HLRPVRLPLSGGAGGGCAVELAVEGPGCGADVRPSFTQGALAGGPASLPPSNGSQAGLRDRLVRPALALLAALVLAACAGPAGSSSASPRPAASAARSPAAVATPATDTGQGRATCSGRPTPAVTEG